MSFNNDGNGAYKVKYDDGNKIIFKILFKKSFLLIMLNFKKKQFHGMSVTKNNFMG